MDDWTHVLKDESGEEIAQWKPPEMPIAVEGKAWHFVSLVDEDEDGPAVAMHFDSNDVSDNNKLRGIMGQREIVEDLSHLIGKSAIEVIQHIDYLKANTDWILCQPTKNSTLQS